MVAFQDFIDSHQDEDRRPPVADEINQIEVNQIEVVQQQRVPSARRTIPVIEIPVIFCLACIPKPLFAIILKNRDLINLKFDAGIGMLILETLEV
jgi:hypothetical protein